MTTPHLGLPLLAAAQAQKHVTHNEALFALDALVQCAILDKDLSTPPAGVGEGHRYIVGPAPIGEWAGKANLIVLRRDGAWLTITPRIGFLAYVVDEALLYVFTSSGWTALTNALTAIQNLGRLGIGTAADAANPFSAKLNAALWTARGAGEGGTGDLRYTLNKESTANVLSLLFQSSYSGRFEIGLIGSDHLVAKVSADGAAWREAMRVDAGTGAFDFLSPESTVVSAPTVDLAAQPSRRLAITGTTTIASFGTGANKERILRFVGVLTLIHNATTLNLRNGGQDIVTAAGDIAHVTSDASGNWSVLGFWPARIGRSLVYTGAHVAGDGTGAPRGYSSGDTPVISGTNSGFQYLTSIRDNGIYGAQLAISDTFDGVYVRRLSVSAWQSWRRIAEFGAAPAFTTITATGLGSPAASSACTVSSDPPGTPQAGSYIQFFGSANGVLPGQIAIGTAGANRLVVSTDALKPWADAGMTLGTGSQRLGQIYSTTGVISTSDARDKNAAVQLNAAEIAWARDLAAEIGRYQFLASIAEKGEGGARLHIGLTVQRAIELGCAHGLDPFRYAFICFDAWDAEPGRSAVEGCEAIIDDGGQETSPAVPAEIGIPAKPAGDRYGFRLDQLALFIARGQEARLALLEAALAA